MENIKKIDIHAHAIAPSRCYPPNPNGSTFITADALLQLYDRLNIERGVLLPLASPEAMAAEVTSEDCRLLANAYSDRFLWFCGVDPRRGKNSPVTDFSHYLNFYKGLGAKGLGELTANLYVDDPLLDNLFAHCAACQMPVTIHLAVKQGGTYGIVDDLGLPRLEKMLKKHKNLIVIGHSQVFWSEISADNTCETRFRCPTGKVTEGRVAQLMRKYKNLYCDISAGSGANAFMRDPAYTAKFVAEFADRILYGCDIGSVDSEYPFRLDAFLTDMRKSGAVSEENYRKIVRENALRLLGL